MITTGVRIEDLNHVIEQMCPHCRELASDLTTAPIHGEGALDKLRREVCKQAGVEEEAMVGHVRIAPLVKARRTFARAAYKMGFSFPKIAKAMGMRHHTSVMYLVHGKP